MGETQRHEKMDDTLEEKKKKKRKLKPHKKEKKILISVETFILSLDHKCDLMHTYDSRISKET
jgi:hypothetical protein